MRKSYIFTAILIVVSIITALSSCKPTKEQKIIIITTNDIHSNIDRFPMLATLVDSLRAANENILLVDAGDRCTGNPYVDMAPKKGYPIIELINTLGYDLATLGNHEFDNGIDTAAARIAESKFKYVLANISTNGSMPQPEPYVILDISGVKLGFVGLINNSVNGHPDGKDESFGAATFTDPIEGMANFTYLKDSCDVLIALTHTGYVIDSLMAQQIEEVDLVIGAHSHTKLPNGVWVNGTLVTQTGKSLEQAGVITITLKNGKITDIANQLVDLSKLKPSQKYADMVSSYKTNSFLETVVGVSNGSLNKLALLNLMSDIINKSAKTDVALYNRGGIRLDSLRAGNITMKDIYSIEPFGNIPFIVDMSLENIKDLILNKFNSKGKESHTVDIYPAGLSYEVVTNNDGEGVNVIFTLDQSNKTKTIFKVAMSDYMYKTYKFSKHNEGVPAKKLITDMAVEYLSKNTPITPNNTTRVVIN